MTTLKVNMDKNTDKKWPLKLAFVTLWSIFVMGFINGMSINSVYMGVPVTPQTGNIIWMGLFPAFGNWWAFGQTLILWGAFMNPTTFQWIEVGNVRIERGTVTTNFVIDTSRLDFLVTRNYRFAFSIFHPDRFATGQSLSDTHLRINVIE